MSRTSTVPQETNIEFRVTKNCSNFTITYYFMHSSPHSVPSGELIERIIAGNDLTEGIAVRYLSQLLSALDCLHHLNIAHLDIKVSIIAKRSLNVHVGWYDCPAQK